MRLDDALARLAVIDRDVGLDGVAVLVNDPALGPDWSIRYGNTRNVLPYSVLIGRDGRIVAQRIGNFDEAGIEAWLKPHL